MFIESLFILPFAIIIFYFLIKNNVNDFSLVNPSLMVILFLAGPMTVIPLFLYIRGVKLSGGERQKISVLRAVISKPSMVLADEPTGNLDAENSSLLVNQMQDISKEFGIKFIIATHDESFKRISNAIYEINNYKFLKNK